MIRRALAALLLALSAAAGAASYDSGSFDTSAFDPGAYDIQGAPTTVPDCTSSPTTQSACVTAMTTAGFSTDIGGACSNTLAAGIVVSTSPAGGSSAPFGSTVSLAVSNGTPCGGVGGPVGMGVGKLGVGTL